MIYTDFESIVVPENNGKQNPDESYTNKYQNHVDCSFCYKLVRVNNQFSKPFKSYFYAKMLFIRLSLIWLKKVNILVT